MLCKSESIVLRSIKYGEQRLIVDMFTRSHGRLAFGVPLPKSTKGRLKKQYFQPLTLLTTECDVRPEQQLQKLREASLLAPLSSLQQEPAKLALALFTAEFLYHALKGEQHNEPLFDYLRSSIEWLDGTTGGFANFHLVLLMRVSRFLGFYPNVASASPTDYFDLRGACFCSVPPPHHDYLMPQEAAHIGLLMRMDYPSMHLFRLSRSQRNRILELLLLFYRLHLPDFPELRSVAVLHDLFSD